MRHQVRHPKKLLVLIYFLLCAAILPWLGGCVSVKLATEEVSKSTSVKLTPPTAPFTPINLKNADESWQNKATGTTLSYLSVCHDSSDPTLESLRDSTLRGLENSNIQSETTINFNSREALKSEINGQLDGVKVNVQLLIFKKNFCNYTISMVGIEGKMKQDSSYFEKFIEGFIVQ